MAIFSNLDTAKKHLDQARHDLHQQADKATQSALEIMPEEESAKFPSMHDVPALELQPRAAQQLDRLPNDKKELIEFCEEATRANRLELAGTLTGLVQSYVEGYITEGQFADELERSASHARRGSAPTRWVHPMSAEPF